MSIISVNATVDQVLKWMIDLFTMNVQAWVVLALVILLYVFGYGYALQQWRINSALRLYATPLERLEKCFTETEGQMSSTSKH